MSTHDDDLRDLLHETAGGITPHGSLEEIRARTAAARRRGWALPALAAVAATALVLGGIGWMVRENDNAGPAGPTPIMVTRQVPVYYVGRTPHGSRLFEEFHSAQVRSDNPVGVPFASGAALVDDSPLDPDLTNLWAGLTDSIGVGNDGPTGKDLQINIVGNLRDRPTGMTPADAQLAVQQLTQTLYATIAKGAAVRVRLDNNPTDMLLGVSIGAQGLLTPDPNALAPVQITSPSNGAVVPAGTVTVKGVASTFEANVVWEVLSGTTVVKHGFTTAAECCTLSPYSFSVDLAPGTYTIVAHDTDESGQGRAVDSDSKVIVVH